MDVAGTKTSKRRLSLQGLLMQQGAGSSSQSTTDYSCMAKEQQEKAQQEEEEWDTEACEGVAWPEPPRQRGAVPYGAATPKSFDLLQFREMMSADIESTLQHWHQDLRLHLDGWMERQERAMALLTSVLAPGAFAVAAPSGTGTQPLSGSLTFAGMSPKSFPGSQPSGEEDVLLEEQAFGICNSSGNSQRKSSKIAVPGIGVANHHFRPSKDSHADHAIIPTGNSEKDVLSHCPSSTHDKRRDPQGREVTPSRSEAAKRRTERVLQGSDVFHSRGALRLHVDHLVNGHIFGIFIAALIVVNAAMMGLQVDVPDDDNQDAYRILEIFFVSVFLIEIVMRVFADGFFFFCGRSWAWNALDALIVVISLMEVVIINSNTPSNFQMLRLLRVVRIFKVLRVIRLFRFFRSLRVMVLSIVSTLRSLVWALLLVVIITYTFGVVFTQAAVDPQLPATLSKGDLDNLLEYYGSIPRSMFFLFKAMTNGVDWGEAMLPLAKVSEVYVAVFLVYVAFVHFAVLNVVTGHFCQNAIESAQKDQDVVIQEHLESKKRYTETLQRLFKSIDASNAGKITLEDFEHAITDRRIKEFFESLEIEIHDAWTIFKLLDRGGARVVDLEEFVVGCLRLHGQARSVDMAKLMYDVDWISKCLGEFMDYTRQEFNSVKFCYAQTSMVPSAIAPTIM